MRIILALALLSIVGVFATSLHISQKFTATARLQMTATNPIIATEKVYLFESDLLTASSAILDVGVHEDIKQPNNKHAIILDRTVFHPQGGGQPSDIGILDCDGKIFKVNYVSIDSEGVIRHIGNWDENDSHGFEVGKPLRCIVDEAKRSVFTKLHSIGHLIDSALEKLEFTKFVPCKGYHFEDSPYVEYKAAPGVEITSSELDALPARISSKLEELIAAEIPTTVSLMSREEAMQVCKMDLATYPDVMRVVTLGDLAIPCGGTHVKNTALLGHGWAIAKIKKKKDNYRVSYSQSKN